MRAPPRHAVIHLPALTADEALLVVHILDRIHDAIWRAHGQAMQLRRDELAALRPASRPASPPPSPDDALF
jgi:hypothetical protein